MSRTIQVTKGNDWLWKTGEPLTISADQVQEHIENPKVHKSRGPDKIHPPVLKELVAKAARPLAIIFEKLWPFGKVPTDWKWGNIAPHLKKKNVSKENPGVMKGKLINARFFFPQY